ncbi:hypothetical protein PtA15_5A836 [Puccinia triticina]|uniref:Uncharacterized protein n=1 Tax=Puccinia triticina TaxID=208348 RepID=A0ABY7CJ54_9BASI|nr:uncharacterized protein PtA15_5A836 [Puccinia triticina]WAQ85261.1 hypothetical protein PtA15_5A836 [Puccinia triticina]WAR58583.1 hypothetical protein PtB15_5B817 [Puccinia triticina]
MDCAGRVLIGTSSRCRLSIESLKTHFGTSSDLTILPNKDAFSSSSFSSRPLAFPTSAAISPTVLIGASLRTIAIKLSETGFRTSPSLHDWRVTQLATNNGGSTD